MRVEDKGERVRRASPSVGGIFERWCTRCRFVADGFPLQSGSVVAVTATVNTHHLGPPQFSILMMGLRQTLFMITASVVDSSHVAVMSSGSLLSALSASQFVDSVCGLCGARNALSKV